MCTALLCAQVTFWVLEELTMVSLDRRLSRLSIKVKIVTTRLAHEHGDQNSRDNEYNTSGHALGENV